MDVVIELKSNAITDDPEMATLNALGTMLWDGACCRLSCEIMDDDGTPVLLQVTVEGDRVVVEQSGNRTTRLVIREGERAVSPYEMPYGSLLVGVTGLRVVNRLTPEGGELLLTYEVDVNATSISTNSIEIRVRRTSLDDESNGRDGQ